MLIVDSAQYVSHCNYAIAVVRIIQLLDTRGGEKIRDERNFVDENVKLILSAESFSFFLFTYSVLELEYLKKKCGLREKFLGLRQ